ncbi:MAG TPA: serine hydrolase, partial [Cyclobacteriaceae bacterium]
RSGEESPIIKRSSLREMHQLQRLGELLPDNKNRDGAVCPVITGYGFGLGYRQDCRKIVTIRHGGGLPGYGSEWRFYPEYGIGIVSLSNLTYGGLGGQNSKALDTLIHLAGLKPMTLPVSSILKQRQGEIVNVISTWSESQLNIFAENFFMDQSLDLRKKISSETLSKIGKVVKVNSIIPENQLRGTFIIEGEKNNLEVFFTLTPERNPLVQQLDLKVLPRQ